MSNRLAIEELVASRPDAARVRAFLAGRRVPIVEGSAVTFLWHGPADAVSVRHWIYALESSTALARIEGTDLWYLTLEIPPGSRVEYKFEVARGGASAWVEDPLNPNRARDPSRDRARPCRWAQGCLRACCVPCVQDRGRSAPFRAQPRGPRGGVTPRG